MLTSQARTLAKKSAIARRNQLCKFAVIFNPNYGVEEVEESSLEAVQGLATTLLTTRLSHVAPSRVAPPSPGAAHRSLAPGLVIQWRPSWTSFLGLAF